MEVIHIVSNIVYTLFTFLKHQAFSGEECVVLKDYLSCGDIQYSMSSVISNKSMSTQVNMGKYITRHRCRLWQSIPKTLDKHEFTNGVNLKKMQETNIVDTTHVLEGIN